MTIEIDLAAEPVKTITEAVEWLNRIANDSAARYENARNAGAHLAAEVYRYMNDPEAVGTDTLAQAYNTFMSLHAAGFCLAEDAD